MATLTHPFVLRFAQTVPPREAPGPRTRVPAIKGLTRLTGDDLARIASGGPAVRLDDPTYPEATQFGQIPDDGDMDWPDA
jgi:hypothetical protein